ncbi:MAG: hypothetical protein OXD44_07620 [Gammaproteobacteria bacterium]|nr:hypothetical protein [Gammaproteobacteria bacterium]MCY4228817.1 hypothetical protein [Gammaproteobacteria bacterium]MCY4313545.1 hypothetical protein [Gammaproteobacteria bacterium]
MKRILLIAIVASVLAGCSDDAKMASRNLSKAADNFEVMRRVVFMNGITDNYMLEIVGLCSIEDQRHQLEVTCKNGEQYVKHFLGLSDNVTYFTEQLTAINVSANHYRVTFKPQAIIPDFDLRGSFEDLTTNSSEINSQG